MFEGVFQEGQDQEGVDREQVLNHVDELFEHAPVTPQAKAYLRRLFVGAILTLPGCGSLIQHGEEREHGLREKVTEVTNPYEYINEDMVREQAPTLHRLIEAARNGIPAKPTVESDVEHMLSRRFPSYVVVLEKEIAAVADELESEWSWGMRFVDGAWYPVVLNDMDTLNGTIVTEDSQELLQDAVTETQPLHLWHNHSVPALEMVYDAANDSPSKLHVPAVRESLYAPPSPTDYAGIEYSYNAYGEQYLDVVKYYLASPNGVYAYGAQDDTHALWLKKLHSITNGKEFLQAVLEAPIGEPPLDATELEQVHWLTMEDYGRFVQACEKVGLKDKEAYACKTYFETVGELAVTQLDLLGVSTVGDVDDSAVLQAQKDKADADYKRYTELVNTLGYAVEFRGFEQNK